MSHFIPKTFIDELLARTDIATLIESYLPLKKLGSNYVACCPFHQEKTASFTVSPQKQIYHCFGCHVGGNAIGFVMDYERIHFVEAVEILAKKLGLEVPKELGQDPQQEERAHWYAVMEEITKFYHKELFQHPRGKQALNYLQRRGLKLDTLKKFGIGYAPPGWSYLVDAWGKNAAQQKTLLTLGLLISDPQKNVLYNRFRDRIIYPIRDRRGRVIAFGGRVLDDSKPKYLNSPETPLFHKSAELYGLFEALQASHHLDRLLIVEGYMDVLMLHQMGLTYTVAVLGTAFNAYHIEKIFRSCSEVIFCFDGDAAGTAGAWKSVENLLPHLREHWQIKFMFLPVGEDPDTLIQKEGKPAFEQRMARALSLIDFFFSYLKSKIDLTSSNARSQLLYLATQYLKKVPDNLMRSLLVQTLSQQVGLDQTEILRHLELEKSPVVPSVEPLKNVFNPPAMLKTALAILLQYPHVIENLSIETEMGTPVIPYIDLFHHLIQLIKAQPGLTTASLLEHFRENAVMPHLIELAHYELMIPEEGVQTEFQGILQCFAAQMLETSIEKLMSKASLQGLNDEEKLQLKKLLEKKHSNS